jgi:hypothetical protein
METRELKAHFKKVFEPEVNPVHNQLMVMFVVEKNTNDYQDVRDNIYTPFHMFTKEYVDNYLRPLKELGVTSSFGLKTFIEYLEENYPMEDNNLRYVRE